MLVLKRHIRHRRKSAAHFLYSNENIMAENFQSTIIRFFATNNSHDTTEEISQEDNNKIDDQEEYR